MASIRIERQNSGGFEVSLTDPEIDARNRNSKEDWQDPCVEYSFKTWDEVSTFLDKVVDKALPADEYGSTFDKAAKEATDE